MGGTLVLKPIVFRLSALSFALFAILQSPALWAAGAGGAGGSLYGGTGGDGNGDGGGGGGYQVDNGSSGSGGSGGTGGNGAGSGTQAAGGVYWEGNGGQGSEGNPGGGGGGGGGAASIYYEATNLAIVVPDGVYIAGNGGRGGQGVGSSGGGGGGAALDLRFERSGLNLQNTLTLQGGNGGAGGGSSSAGSGGGGGGGGGDGLFLQGNNNSLNIRGTVTGGAGGAGGAGHQTQESGQAGKGGSGIFLNGSNNNVFIYGAIAGGMNGDTGHANAVTLNGSGNRLGLVQGFSLTGNVVANGLSNTLTLGGTASATLDASLIGTQIQNFSNFEKAGSGSWTLTGTTSSDRVWNVLAGNLTGSTASFGNGNIFNNASLTFDQASDATYAGTISGGGSLTKSGAGALVLTQNHAYTGGTTITSGTLQVGNGGTSGSLTGNVLNNAVLRFNRADDVAYARVVSGTGALVKDGAGNLTLGSNTYAGGTTINSGTLTGTASSFGLGAIVNNARLVFQQSQDATLSNLISGSGNLTKAGTGTLVMTANQTYTGGTTLSAGTLQIGNGGNSGSLAGDVLNNGVLRFNRADDLNHTGVVAGTGGLVKDGAGNLTLGSNSYAGGTLINSGTVTGTASSFGTGDIVNDAALVVDQDQEGVLSNSLSGVGSLTKRGLSKLIINGSASAAGGTTVDAGQLIVGASAGSDAYLASNVIVNEATLGGHGRILGDVTLAANSMLAPGNSIGTLTVDGDVTFDRSSMLEIEAAPDGRADRLISTGTVNLGGSSLRVLADLGEWGPLTTYTVISARDVTGTFGSVTTNLTFLTHEVDYSLADQVQLLLLRNDLNFDTVGRTYNQRSTAVAVESGGAEQRIYRVISVLDAERARAAFDSLSGELHANVQGAMLEDSRNLRNAIHTRQRSTHGLLRPTNELNPGNGLTFWLKGEGNHARLDSDGNASTFRQLSRTTFFGGDIAMDKTWTLGAALGLGTSDLEDDRKARADSKNRSVALYAAANWNAVNIRLGTARTWHTLDTRRTVRAGILDERTHSQHNATTTQVFGELGYRIEQEPYILEPFVGLAHVRFDADRFFEHGGDSAVSGHAARNAIDYSTLGMNLSLPLGNLGDKPFGLHGSVGWQHALSSETPEVSLSMAGTESFDIRGVPLRRNSAVAQAGGWLRLSPTTTLDLRYGGRVAGDISENSVSAGVNHTF